MVWISQQTSFQPKIPAEYIVYMKGLRQDPSKTIYYFACLPTEKALDIEI